MSVALITGTSTGIGRSTAIELAKNGYRVFASMRDPTAADPEMVSSGKVEVIRLDVNDNLSMESAVAGVLELTGRIDILVNNAGIGIGGSVEETTEKDLRDIMETNFFGAWRMMQLVLPGMRIRGWRAHRERDLGSRQVCHGVSGPVRVLETCAGGGQRSPRAGGISIQRAGFDH